MTDDPDTAPGNTREASDTGASPRNAETPSPVDPFDPTNPQDRAAAARNHAQWTAEAYQEAQSSDDGRLRMLDYILIGVYTALYFVLIAIPALPAHLIPVLMPFMGLGCGIFGGTAYLLALTKSRRFGTVTIMGVLLALLIGVIHGNYYTVATALAAALVADLIARRGDYGNRGLIIVSAGVFNLWTIGMFLPFYVGRSSYLANLSSAKGSGYASELASLFPGWLLPVLVVLNLAGGVIGAIIALGLFRRHFHRAGLA